MYRISSPLTNIAHVNIFNVFVDVLSFIRIYYDRNVLGEMETVVYTATCKALFWLAPFDSFFYEYWLVVSLYNVQFSFQINCLFPALR
jgi:hypothetical protein